MSATRIGVLLVSAGSVIIGAAYLATMVAGAPPSWAPWAVALGGSAASVALFVLGAASRGPVGRGVALLLAALGVVIAAAFCLALAHNAVHAGMAGRTGMVVGFWKNEFTHVPIALAVSERKRIDPAGRLWNSVLAATGQPRAM